MSDFPLNLCTYKWDLNADTCACDLQFNEWLSEEALTRKAIYHFGTGSHHLVGVEQSTNDTGNTVLGITASLEELDAYLKIIASCASISQRYLVYFGDIYLSNPMLLPEFDVITMFHLCEFSDWYTTSEQYGGLDDRLVLDLFTSRLRSGGHILFYTQSMAFDKARPLIHNWKRDNPVQELQSFKDLAVYRKIR